MDMSTAFGSYFFRVVFQNILLETKWKIFFFVQKITESIKSLFTLSLNFGTVPLLWVSCLLIWKLSTPQKTYFVSRSPRFSTNISEITYNIMLYRWLPELAELFLKNKSKWVHLAPARESDSRQLIREFFDTVGTLMSRQLRECVTNSLSDFVQFMEEHKVQFEYLVWSTFKFFYLQL